MSDLNATDASSTRIPDKTLDSDWTMWKNYHKKNYESEQEDIYRRLIWEEDLKYTSIHNLKHRLNMTSFTVCMNEFSDMTYDEFKHNFVMGSYDADKSLPCWVDTLEKNPMNTKRALYELSNEWRINSGDDYKYSPKEMEHEPFLNKDHTELFRDMSELNITDAPSTSTFDKTLNFYWTMWKNVYKKKYESVQEDNYRKRIWEENLKGTNLHNLKYSMKMTTYTQGINHLSDKTHDEYKGGCMMGIYNAAGEKQLLNLNVLPETFTRIYGIKRPMTNSEFKRFLAKTAKNPKHFHYQS